MTTTSEHTTLNLTISESIATITLNRPKVNGMNIAMVKELGVVAKQCADDNSVRAVILTGSGAFFSAGGDVKAMAEGGADGPAILKEMADNLHEAISTFARMSKPVIVAVNGMAAGGGLSLAMIGDIVIAAESASFTMAYTAAGLTPDGSSTYFLPRIIGLRRTMELTLTNRKLSANDALDWHMVNQVVPDDQLMPTVMGLAAKLAQGPTDAYGEIKKLMLSTFTNSLETQMELEGQAISGRLNTPNGKEGVKAFSEKRRPKFI